MFDPVQARLLLEIRDTLQRWIDENQTALDLMNAGTMHLRTNGTDTTTEWTEECERRNAGHRELKAKIEKQIADLSLDFPSRISI